MKITEKALYTTAEAGAIMCVSAKCIRYYIATRKLRAVQRGNGYWLIHADDIRVYLGLDPDETLAPIQEQTNATDTQGNGPGDPGTAAVDGSTPRPR